MSDLIAEIEAEVIAIGTNVLTVKHTVNFALRSTRRVYTNVIEEQ